MTTDNDDAEGTPEDQAWMLPLHMRKPKPINFHTATAHEPEPDPAAPGGVYYMAGLEYAPLCEADFEVTAEEHRIIVQYEAARKRQEEAEDAAASARWDPPPPPPPPREPEPEDVSPTGKLTPRQEDFAQHYSAQPVATRAAVLAGFAESNAGPYGSRLLKNPLVLDRIAQLRAARGLRYTLERETLHDKLEAVFFEAIGERNLAAAVASIRLQASLADMFARPRRAGAAGASATDDAERAEPRATGAGKPTPKPRKAKRKAKKSQARRR